MAPLQPECDSPGEGSSSSFATHAAALSQTIAVWDFAADGLAADGAEGFQPRPDGFGDGLLVVQIGLDQGQQRPHGALDLRHFRPAQDSPLDYLDDDPGDEPNHAGNQHDEDGPSG